MALDSVDSITAMLRALGASDEMLADPMTQFGIRHKVVTARNEHSKREVGLDEEQFRVRTSTAVGALKRRKRS